jgi:hypothetical protein
MRTLIQLGSKSIFLFILLIHRFGTSTRKDVRRNVNWPGPGDTNVPEYTTAGRKIKLQTQITDPEALKQARLNINKQDDGLGPGQYNAKLPNNAPVHSFGTRFNSSVRSKDHLKPRKVDGPGPGAYKLPSSVKVEKRRL